MKLFSLQHCMMAVQYPCKSDRWCDSCGEQRTIPQYLSTESVLILSNAGTKLFQTGKACANKVVPDQTGSLSGTFFLLSS